MCSILQARRVQHNNRGLGFTGERAVLLGGSAQRGYRCAMRGRAPGHGVQAAQRGQHQQHSHCRLQSGRAHCGQRCFASQVWQSH